MKWLNRNGRAEQELGKRTPDFGLGMAFPHLKCHATMENFLRQKTSSLQSGKQIFEKSNLELSYRPV
jgi:hypothetical protein